MGFLSALLQGKEAQRLCQELDPISPRMAMKRRAQGWWCLGGGPELTLQPPACCTASTAYAEQHSMPGPFPHRKCCFGPWLGQGQPCLLDPQCLPNHRLSRDIPAAHCEYQPHPCGCPERLQQHSAGAVGADVALGAAPQTGPQQLKAVALLPLRATAHSHAASPRHGAWHRPATAHGITLPWHTATQPWHGEPRAGPLCWDWERVLGGTQVASLCPSQLWGHVCLAGDRRDSGAPRPFSTATRHTLRAQPQHTASKQSADPSSP